MGIEPTRPAVRSL